MTPQEYREQAQALANAYCDEETFSHTSVVVQYALELAAAYGADEEVIEIAAWLHDIGRVDTAKGHAERSVELAKKLLQEHPKGTLIREVVLKHGKEHIDENNPVEIKVLQASDALATLFDDERLSAYLEKKGKEKYKALISDKLLAKASVLPISKQMAEKRIQELLDRLKQQ